MDKNLELIASFKRYCITHPEERFWQALRNWMDVDAICIRTGDEASGYDYWDTYFIQRKKK